MLGENDSNISQNLPCNRNIFDIPNIAYEQSMLFKEFNQHEQE